MLLIGILLVWPFIFDAGLTFLIRLYKGENVCIPHRSFLFHRLVISGRSHLFVTLLYMGLGLSGATLALLSSLNTAESHVAVALLLPLLCLTFLCYVLQQEHRGSSPARQQVIKHPGYLPGLILYALKAPMIKHLKRS